MFEQFVDESVPHFIVGDFNSLSADDFTASYQHWVADMRHKSQWEPVRFDVTDNMKEWDYVDVFKTLNPDLKDLAVQTNHYNTRIDYIWASQVRVTVSGSILSV
jgi:exonuclease III